MMFLSVLLPLEYVWIQCIPQMFLILSHRPCTFGITMYPLDLFDGSVFLCVGSVVIGLVFVKRSCVPLYPKPMQVIYIWLGPLLNVVVQLEEVLVCNKLPWPYALMC